MSAFKSQLQEAVVNSTTKLASTLTNPAYFPIYYSVTIICFIYNCISNPEGAINQFMILIVDMVYNLFPSTPSQYQIGTMLGKFADAYPLIGWGAVYEIFSGMAGIFGLWCVVKLWKFLPFT